MSEGKAPAGSIGWVDLTVDHAPRVREFYQSVIGWSSQGVEMGGYEDWCMVDGGGNAVAGICHARGVNEDLPAQWLIYITVDELDVALARVADGGGQALKGPATMGDQGRFAVIRDPAGAVCALFEPPRG